MSNIKSAMIMAAGFGTRMGTLTHDRPKPLLELGEARLIDHALTHLKGASVEHAVVNLHYLADQIQSYLSGTRAPRISFSVEEPEILDTGGGIVQALPQLGPEPFAVLNSDAVFRGPNPVSVLCENWNADLMDALLLLVPTTSARAYHRAGDFRLSTALAAPERRGDASSAPYVYTGAQIIRPEVFENAPAGAFSTNLIWDRLLRDGRLRALPYDGTWVDVGTPAGLREAEAVLREPV
ncbi:MAG: nucleotidyltransferase family protein [Pseudomonadota bacterium]